MITSNTVRIVPLIGDRKLDKRAIRRGKKRVVKVTKKMRGKRLPGDI